MGTNWKNRDEAKEKERLRLSYIRRKEKIAAYYKQDRIDHPEKYRTRAKNYYKNNIDKIRAYRHTNIERITSQRIKKKYGITTEQKNGLLIEQSGLCAICGIDIMTSENIHIDHCHATGKVRGLLCGNCNIGLGQFKDNITSLSSAIKYLSENNG